MSTFAALIEFAPLVGLGGLTLVVGVSFEVRHRRAWRGLTATLSTQSERIAAFERDLAALLSCSRGVAERLAKSEGQQRRMQTQLDKLHSNDDQQLAVQHAMKLLNNGVDLKNVTELCELSEGEVEILQNLARHRQAA